MRVLMVTNTYAPARNGVARWAEASVRGLRERGHEVDVLTYAHHARDAGEPGVHEIRGWVGLDTDFQVAPVPRRLPDALDDVRWDVVHCHHPVLLGERGPALARACGAKTFFTCHSVYTDYLDEYALGIGHVLAGVLSRRVARFANRCDMTLAPSTHVMDWMRDLGVHTPVELMEAPADTTRVPPRPRVEAREALGLAPDAQVALYVGRIAEEKRLDTLLREFALVAPDAPAAQLVYVGGGAMERPLTKLAAKLGLADRFRIVSSVDGPELGLWYSAADINVSASRSETGPLTVVEAMACGTPTVAVRGPGFEDRVEDGVNGLLTGPGQGALARGIAQVLADEPLRQRLAAGAASRAPRYALDAVTDRLVGMYERAGS